ncbi:TRAP transporter small permease subunit [Hoeflea alexandrii]|uniref:TRAP transporter small permease subunit n=1 Tax=Hoeflea alexandrii TaxID=288436 RepID=UPI0022B05721|nr:TRAP transporter small permease [Hoeflea alexandrii]MCZ4291504.1 TRAP transporter small permease [Hoeflea alexandrii]
MARFLTLIDRLSRLAELAAVVLIFGYCALMLTEVVARAQAKSFSFTWEFSQYAMAAIFALASGSALRTAVHVRITLVTEKLPENLGKWIDVLANLAALVIVATIVLAMWTKTSTSFERNTLATSVTKTPLWVPQALVLWGFAQLWLDLLARLIRRATGRTYEWRSADKEQADV